MREKIKIIHAADLHLDSPFEALGAEKAAERRKEQRTLLRRIADLAADEGADLLLLAGDLLDSRFAYAETVRTLCETLAGLQCPVFISPGNHDFYSAASAYAKLELPENVHIFKEPRVTCVPLKELGARIWGAGFGDTACPPLLAGMKIEKEPGILDIGVFHADAGKPDSPYCPVSEDDIAGSGLDYLALGHVHTYSGLKKAGNTFYAYPGCPEGRGFDECGEKGVLAVEVSGGFVQARFIETAMREYRIIKADAGLPLDGQLLTSEKDIVRVELTGECDEVPDIKSVREAYKDRFFALEVRDKTQPRASLWNGAREDSLRGLFLRKMQNRLQGAQEDAERERVIAAVRWGVAALDGGEEADSL